ncbi:MAG: aldo/keto reductase [Prevotellaceae bacterium]|jgi:predicted aldo/keto reductase-like oxidoreductase|nr:aldo/keto reductase [Prevotellaceae bacterium]
MKNLNRRNFLRLTAAGSAGLFIPSKLPAMTNRTGQPEEEKINIEHRTLGRTGIKVPILSMGVMRADNPNLVKAAIQSGIVHFDTAHSYQEGKNELMLGKIFKDVPRESLVVATKIKVDQRKGIFSKDAPEQFLEKFNISMQRLGLDYVDILYFHAIDSREATLHEPILKVMQDLKAQGRTKNIGVSTHSNEPEVINAAVDSGVYDVVLTAYNFKQKHLPELNAAIDRAAAAGLGVVAMKTMAGAKDINIPAALKWVFRNKNIHTTIPGFTAFDELDVCLACATDPQLTGDEKNYLAQADVAPSLYCQQCNSCTTQCTKHLPIPDLMRAYMYNYGYRYPAEARTLVASLHLSSNPCTSCTSCKVKCTNGFAVAEKVRDIARIAAVPREFLT